MKLLATLPILVLLVLASAASAAVDTLNINITVTIASSNSIEWAVADAAADVVGTRTWSLSGKALDTDCDSTAGTVTGPTSSVIAAQGTALNFVNRGGIAVAASVSITNDGANWDVGAAAGTNIFTLAASVNNGVAYGLAVSAVATPVQLSASLAKDATCQLALRFHTPVTVTASSNSVAVSVVAVQN